MSGYHVAKHLLNKEIQIIPLDVYKKPIVAFKDIEIDSQFIESNQHLYESTHVLGVLARGLWCVDIDVNHTDNENGFDSLKEIPYYDEFVNNMNNTLVQTTASGGKHVIFKKRNDIKYSQKINYLPSVDIKAHYNTYFVLAGSRTNKGTYTHNGNDVTHYNGKFEKRIFSKRGNYEKQLMERFSVNNVLPHYDFTDFKGGGKGGEGKRAYKRIIEGTSSFRNDDLFKAVSYAVQYNVDIEPLRILIGDNKNGDVLTADQWERTVESAKNSNTPRLR